MKIAVRAGVWVWMPKRSVVMLPALDPDPLDAALILYCQRHNVPSVLVDCEQAADAWGANCGPMSLAAAIGLSTVGEAHRLVQPFRGFMTPTEMRAAVGRAADRNLCRYIGRATLAPGDPDPWPEPGVISLVKIQWLGPWCAPGVNPRAAYHYSHFIAARRGVPDDGRLAFPHPADEVFIYDCTPNCWVPLAQWSAWNPTIWPKRATGWAPVNRIAMSRRTG